MEVFFNAVSSYQLYGLVAFVVTVFATPIAMRVAHRFGVLDIPDAKLKPHAKPIPYLGGTAICLGWAVALLVAMIRGTVEWRHLLPILLGGLAISVIGLMDDLRNMTPRLRIALGTLVISLVIVTTGSGSQLVHSLLGQIGIDLPRVVAVPLSAVISIVLVLGACNSANLIDGLDGLCTGSTAIISFGFLVLAAHLAVHQYSHEGDPARLVLAIAMMGAALGFLPLNFNPAKIFMGDAGSMLLGYNCGMMIVLFAERGIFRWVLGGLMVFALPIADTALAMFRRWRHGRSMFAGDRSHFYDQLVDRGLSVKRVVFVSYVLTALYATLGCMPIWLRTRYTIPLYAAVVLLTVWAIWAARMIRVERPQPASSPPSHV
jgi:UDP-GlcNAc:undecaprenyl-phosphate GlcNAc-1-phosphate transferase